MRSGASIKSIGQVRLKSSSAENESPPVAIISVISRPAPGQTRLFSAAMSKTTSAQHYIKIEWVAPISRKIGLDGVVYQLTRNIEVHMSQLHHDPHLLKAFSIGRGRNEKKKNQSCKQGLCCNHSLLMFNGEGCS